MNASSNLPPNSLFQNGDDKIPNDAVVEVLEAAAEYSSHREQFRAAMPTKERLQSVEIALNKAFSNHIRLQEVPFILFGELNAEELADAFYAYPLIVKPVLACVNIAGRAIKRDLGVNIDTYAIKLTQSQASMLAGFVKPLLPDAIAVPALIELDRFFWTDKTMRATKGSWETFVREQISQAAQIELKKRKFLTKNGAEQYELDAAFPAKGEPIFLGIDVKRIEAQQDLHKRADEIINKANKYKDAYPTGIFIAVVYFPFPIQHLNLISRLKSTQIDNIFFAGESQSSIKACADMVAGFIVPFLHAE